MKLPLRIETSTDIVWAMEIDGKFIHVSPSVEKLLGYAPAELKDKGRETIFTPESLKRLNDALESALSQVKDGSTEITQVLSQLDYIHKDGSTLQTETSISAAFNENGLFDCFLGVSRKAGQRHLAEEGAAKGLQRELVRLIRLLSEGMHKLDLSDTLTGVLNRQGILEIGRNEFDRFRRYQGIFCAILVDIDNLKAINDKYGYGVGDMVLKSVANTCQSILRRQDSMGRYGSDEFLLFLPETNTSGAAIVAVRLRGILSQLSFKLEEQRLQITVSVGVASSAAAQNLESLVQNAIIALDEAKKNGGDIVQLYSAST